MDRFKRRIEEHETKLTVRQGKLDRTKPAETEMMSTSGRRQKPSSARSGQGSARSKLIRIETVDQPGDVINVN